jgi:hypothetical protein
MTRRIFLDTEWTKPPWSKQSELMWIGLADEEGRSWYGISSEVYIDPSTNDFISGVFRLITPDEPRRTNEEIAAAVIDFCGDVDEFWAWIPTMERFAEWFGLGEEAADLYAKHWDVDLQMVRSLVQPWPDGNATPSVFHQRHIGRVLRSSCDTRGRRLASSRGREHRPGRCPPLWPGDLRNDGGSVAAPGADGSEA